MANKKNKKNGKIIAIISSICAALIVVIVILVLVIPKSTSAPEPKEVELEISQMLAVSRMTLAVAQDRVNGSGTVTQETCKTFREIAKKYDEQADWFDSRYCSYLIYADYNETEKTLTVTINDDAHAAIYTFNYDRDRLLNYEFVKKQQSGRSITVKD